MNDLSLKKLRLYLDKLHASGQSEWGQDQNKLLFLFKTSPALRKTERLFMKRGFYKLSPYNSVLDTKLCWQKYYAISPGSAPGCAGNDTAGSY